MANMIDVIEKHIAKCIPSIQHEENEIQSTKSGYEEN